MYHPRLRIHIGFAATTRPRQIQQHWQNGRNEWQIEQENMANPIERCFSSLQFPVKFSVFQRFQIPVGFVYCGVPLAFCHVAVRKSS